MLQPLGRDVTRAEEELIIDLLPLFSPWSEVTVFEDTPLRTGRIEPVYRRGRARWCGFPHLRSAHLAEPLLFALDEILFDTESIFGCFAVEVGEFLRVLVCEFLLRVCEEGGDVL